MNAMTRDDRRKQATTFPVSATTGETTALPSRMCLLGGAILVGLLLLFLILHLAGGDFGHH